MIIKARARACASGTGMMAESSTLDRKCADCGRPLKFEYCEVEGQLYCTDCGYKLRKKRGEVYG